MVTEAFNGTFLQDSFFNLFPIRRGSYSRFGTRVLEIVL